MEKTSAHRTNLAKYDNSWYKPGSVLKIGLWMVFSMLFIDTNFPIPLFAKRGVLRLFGAKIDDTAVLKPKIKIKYPWLLQVGKHVWIGENVWIDNLEMVTLEANCCLSQGSMLLTGNHDYTKTTFDLITAAIVIEEGAWIGAKAVVCPGITVASHAVLTVNSVATNNLAPYTIYQGNPAKAIKQRNIKS